MITEKLKINRLLVFAVALAAAGFAGPAFAEAKFSSPWQDTEHSRIRLIAASNIPYRFRPGSGTVAGLEIELDEGWKTYWRTPGDGLPPSVDWTKSRNLGQALWPSARCRHFWVILT